MLSPAIVRSPLLIWEDISMIHRAMGQAANDGDFTEYATSIVHIIYSLMTEHRIAEPSLPSESTPC